MADYYIHGVCPACGAVTRFKYEGDNDDCEGGVMQWYTCQECGSTRSKRSIAAATIGTEVQQERKP